VIAVRPTIWDLIRMLWSKHTPSNPPSPLCIGNPTKEACIRYGYCTRSPACDE